jgi:hypothetical protein
MSNPGPWWGSGSKGDIAAGAIGYATGFAVDVFLFPLGVPPGTTASIFAVGAIGLKNAFQVARSSRRPKVDPQELEKRAINFVEFVERAHKGSSGAASVALADLLRSIQADFDLWKGNFIDAEKFASNLDEHVQRFRTI